jgi:hypothetical protein
VGARIFRDEDMDGQKRARFIERSPDHACSAESPGCSAPKLPMSASGDVNDVMFPCGQTIGADGDTLNLYYGAADSCIALATGSIRALLAWLHANPSSEDGVAR